MARLNANKPCELANAMMRTQILVLWSRSRSLCGRSQSD
ncbi:hypothetical protein APA_3026 [Pseudanabaena sp. lw0831]|nr:hypothetical protein APA_3026 [Pseudanabaena sp. lw0831]